MSRQGTMPKRPTVVITTEIVRYIKSGIPFEAACRAVLGRRYLDAFEWMKNGAGENPRLLRIAKPYRDFHDAVIRAEAMAESRFAAALTSAALGGQVISETVVTQADGSTRRSVKRTSPKARAALAWLERQRRNEWRPPTVKKETTKLEIQAQIKAMHQRGYDPREFPEDQPIHLPDGRVIPVTVVPDDPPPPDPEEEVPKRNARRAMPAMEEDV